MKILICLLLFISSSLLSISQESEPNYNEAKVPVYILPDPLVFDNGFPVNNKKDWEMKKNEIYLHFEEEVYGVAPEWEGSLKSTIVSRKDAALDGIGIRKEVRLELVNEKKTIEIMILIYLPNNSKKGPLFLGYNFHGNHTITDEPEILISDSWVRNNIEIGTSNNRANENGRGKSASKWPIKEIVMRGFGVATVYYGDVDPDFNDGFKNGVHQLFDTIRDSSSWGSIATWAWGLSRVMDYLETDKEIDASKVIVIGHSRLGKAALWATASDPRFAMAVSNNSGCGGAALFQRRFGETIERINNTFPHWFCDNFKKYNNNEELLPIDQHELIALVAPRPVYVASAAEDLWADPKGEFLSCVYASPVYELLGVNGFPIKEMPTLSNPVFSNISYHIRPGKHDITLYDWQRYMDFAEHYFTLKK